MNIKRVVRWVACLVALSAPLAAKQTILDAVPFEGKKVSIDGMLREWPKLTALSETVSGKGGKDPSAAGLVAYDADNLYVGMRVIDASLTRTKSFGRNEDHASLKIAFPNGAGGYKTYQVGLYPGVPGKSTGAVTLPGVGKVSGAKIVEMAIDGGLSFEASIPWKAFPLASKVRSGLRGALLYHDSDGGSVKTVIGTAKGSGNTMPVLTIEAEYAMNDALIFTKGLSTRPTREVYGNLVGGRMLEHIAAYERYLTVSGWDYRGGKEFFYQDLNLLSPKDLKQLAVADFDKDGKDELFIVRKVGSAGRARIYAEVWRFTSDTAAPTPIFQHEVGVTDGEANVENQVSLSKKGSRPSITVAQGDYDKLVPDEWKAPMAGEETLPTIMPWEPVASRQYEWKDGQFEMVKERAGKAKLKKPNRGTKLFSGSRPSGDPLAGDGKTPPPAPRPPSADELMDQVYKLYRKDHGVGSSKPSHDFVTDVAGDETTERVLVHGSDLVVFGKRFKEGTSYVYTKIGVKEAKDILSVTAQDVTGDGKADVIVRAVLHAKASKSLGGKVVTRHALFIYKVQQHAITRIFAAETGRTLGQDRILGLVKFVPRGSGVSIELLPGRAVGWTQKSYPFPEDRTPYGGLEPLLLPWTEMPSRRYLYQGTEFKQE